MSISSKSYTFERVVAIGGNFNISFSHKRTQFSSNTLHSHDFCELTVYTEGKKSVFVENNIYISENGSAFTFRPGELHCGLHRENAIHERYVITFAPNCFDIIPDGNSLLRCFFERESGRNNMINLPDTETREGFRLLNKIFELGESRIPEKNALMLSHFIQYLVLLNNFYKCEGNNGSIPKLLHDIIGFIDTNLQHKIRITELCENFGISISSLERMFIDIFNKTPREFIFIRRLEYAKQLLRGGSSVTDACFGAGFSDYSHFIKNFRDAVGTTPAKYAKQQNRVK
ncbi:MAG: AraC family transcriptional regulator [Clostridiales bacterium]|nr:AraC family transcriptional regulator [Clostridiales bacterium]